MSSNFLFYFNVANEVGQVVPGGEEFQEGKGYRLRFDREIGVKLPSNVYVCHSRPSCFFVRVCSFYRRYAVTCTALGFENSEPKLFRCKGSKRPLARCMSR